LIFINSEKVRNFLITNKIVYTLRQKDRRITHSGLEKVATGNYYSYHILAKVKIAKICEIAKEEELQPYYLQSGFESVTEWLKFSEELFHVKLPASLYKAEIYRKEGF
jgi:hypothetical protein